MGYRTYITRAGYELQAKLFAEGGDFLVTKVEVGRGVCPEGTNPSMLTGLVERMAAATSTKPRREGCEVSLEVEYRSDLNGDLETAFQINEFGVFALGVDGTEILLLYGDLSDYPETAVPQKYGGCVRRYPVNITIGPDAEASLDYPAAAWMTCEEVDAALSTKQPKLAGQPGQVVGFDADGAAVAHQADAAQVSYDGTQSGLQAETVQGAVDELGAGMARVSNKNLLHNWYWADPVNQRRQLAYTEVGYAIDRWRTDGGVTVENGFITLSPSIAIFQKFENQEIFFGSTVTISALTADGQLVTSTGVLPQARPSVNTNYIPTDTNGIMVYMRISEENQKGGAYVAFYLGNARSTPVNMLAAKVELSPVQTLAHKVGDTWVLNDPPPDKALELLKCQRFYSDAGTVRGLAGYISEGGEYGTFFVPTPATMRANPAVTCTRATIRVAGANYSAENVSLSKLSSCGIAISAASPGMTAYASQPCGFFAENLAFSADL